MQEHITDVVRTTGADGVDIKSGVVADIQVEGVYGAVCCVGCITSTARVT